MFDVAFLARAAAPTADGEDLRVRMPLGGPLAFTAAELARFNEDKPADERFAPYG